VIHVTSVNPELRVLAIGPQAPKSEGDFFALNLARARADAVLTSGSIVRLEPSYQLALAGPHGPALERYRREVLGKHGLPRCAIMTRDGRLPRLHPLWDDGSEKLVLTPPEHAEALERELAGRAEVLAVDRLDARRAVEVLKQRGAKLISIEAGPGANGPLYDTPAVVSELLLSIYWGPPVQLGGALSPKLRDGMACISDVTRSELSGLWRYQRWLRR
jgi:riboflavin biosynthesis pyrimidine reductase